MNDFPTLKPANGVDLTAISSFAIAAEKMKRRLAGSVGMSLAYDENEPNTAAKNLAIATELGVSQLFVDADPERYAALLREKRASNDLKDAPKTAAWLADMGNGVLAKDDLDNLTWFERTLNAPTQGMIETADAVNKTEFGKGFQTGVTGMKQMGTAVATIPINQTAQFNVDLLAAYERVGGMDPSTPQAEIAKQLGIDPRSPVAVIVEDFIQGDDARRKKYVDQAVAGLKSNKELMSALVDQVNAYSLEMQKTAGRMPNFTDIEDVNDFTDWLSFNTGQAIPYLAAVFASGALGGAPAIVAAGYIMGVGDIQSGLIEQGITDQGGAALVGGIPYAALEYLGPAAAPFRGVSANVLGKVAQSYFKRLGREIPQQAIEEFINEVGQEIIKDYAVAAGGGPEVELTDETLLRWFDAGMAGAAAGVTMAPLVTGSDRRIMTDMEAASRAGKTADTLSQVEAQALASKLRERAPDKFKEALDAQGLGDQAVFVPADALKEYFQAKDVALDEETLQAWGIDPIAFEEAAQSGNDVAVPMSNYATYIAGTDAAQWFAENATSDPEEMSIAVAKAFNASINDVMEEAFYQAERARMDAEETRAADVQIYDQMFSQLRAAGRSPDVARNEAQVWSAFWRTMGERYGEDPLDLARSMGVQVRGPQSPEFRRRDQLDIALNTLRTQGAKALKPKGLSLAEFVKAKGGIQDTGGDVAAMEPPKGVVAETAKAARDRAAQPTLDGLPAQARGLTLDEMGRMAAEAGYFPDLMGEVTTGTKGEASDFAARLLEALGDDVAGRPVYAEGEGPDTAMQALSEALSERGLDIATATNDEIVAALEATDGQTFNQDGTLKADTRILYQPGKRGSIVIPADGVTSGQTVINLFESADLSSFLHESSHFFLEAFTSLASDAAAPQQMRDDLATIREWLGNDGGPLTVEQHEKFARGGEAYFMEGKAPSLALADAFSRFKAWLTRIYKTALGLNVKITPEIREVMDRMLATDAEIAAAREAQSMSPLFADAPPGMSESEFATYRRMARRATEQAEQTLLEKTMAKVRREKEAWFRAEKKAVFAEVADEFDRRPEYRAIDMLANQTWIGAAEGQEIPDMQIDRKMLVEQFGEGVIPELSRTKLGGKRAIYGENGASPEEVAEFFGFKSAAEMVAILQNTGKKRDAVAAEVDRRMTERHGDPLNDGSIEEEALAAIHSEQQANTSVAEARHMARQLGRSTSGMTAKIYRQRARAMVGRMAVRDAIRPERYLAAERKAARAAQDAFAKVAKGSGKAEQALAEALQAKEQQILNGFIYDEARQVAEYVQKGREKMRAYDKKSVREKLEGGYIEQIDGILADYDFRVRGQKQIARSESLKAFIDRMIEEGREAEMNIDARLMDEANRKHYTKLTVDELRGLFDTVENLDHLGRFKQRLRTAQRRRILDESAGRVAGQIRAHKKPRKPSDNPRRALQFIQLFADPDTIAIDLDGGEEFGPVYDEILRDINEGDARAEARQAEAGAAIRALFLRHYTKAEIRALGKELGIPGAEAWTKEEILTLAMNMGNEDNYQRVMDQRVDQSRRLTPETRDALLSTLEDRDWRFAQDMIDEVNKYYNELNEVHRRQTDTSLKKVEAKVMTNLAPSWWVGGYYPIKFDPSVGGRKSEAYAEVTLQKQQTAGFMVANVKKGMTHERQASGGGQTVQFSLSVPISHIRDVIRVIELSEAVTATQRILRHDDVVRAFQETGTTEIKESLQLVVDAVANGPQFNNDWMNWAARTLKTNFSLAKLGLNLKTITLQVTGLPQSAVVVGWGNLAKAMSKYFASPSRMASLASEVTAMSDVMRRRRMAFEKDLYEIRNQIETASPVKGRISEGRDIVAQIAMAPITYLQFWIVDMPTWLAAYEKFKRAGKSDADAIHFADKLVERAQDSGRMPTRSQIELGSTSKRHQQSDLVRIFTTLGGYMFNKANRMRVEVLRTKYGMQGDDSVAAKSAMALGHAANIFIMLTAEAAMMGTLYAWMSDEDDDDEKLLGFIGKEAVGALTGGIPFIRDVYGKAQGFDAGLIGSVIGDIADIYTQTAQWEFDPALVRAYMNLAGDITGLPTTAISRAVSFAAEPDDISPAEALFGRNPLNR